MFDIAELKRLVESDPADIDAKMALVASRARIDGSDVYLEPLLDLATWAQTPEVLQDAAIEEVCKRINQKIGAASKEINTFCCDEYIVEDQTYNELAFRIASFVLEDSGIRLQLIPGEKDWDATGRGVNLDPFLIGKWPLVKGQWHYFYDEWDWDLPVTKPRAEIIAFLKERKLRLPTFAEWGHACRAGASSYMYIGDEVLYEDRELFDKHVWHSENSTRGGCRNCMHSTDDHMGKKCAKCKCRRAPQDVSADSQCLTEQPCSIHENDKAWNAFGLVDLLGNVEEYFSSDPQSHFRRTTGGSWFWDPHSFNFGDMLMGPSEIPQKTQGARPALSIPGYKGNNIERT